MKNVPEIAPEIRGLLEEIVADPRSSIRLVPRRALCSWFDTGETARAREISATRAERHLIEVHREALADLLCEAAWIAYWKAPIFAHKPADEDGVLYHPATLEPLLIEKSARLLENRVESPSGVELLRQILGGVNAGQAPTLAQASLSLVPSDKARFRVGLTLPWSEPRTAIRILSKLASTAIPADIRLSVLLPLGARLCAAGAFSAARAIYKKHGTLVPDSPLGIIYAFNLSCFLGEARSAMEEGRLIGKACSARDPRLIEAAEIICNWARTRPPSDVARAVKTSAEIGEYIPESARTLCPGFQT